LLRIDLTRTAYLTSKMDLPTTCLCYIDCQWSWDTQSMRFGTPKLSKEGRN
jgi:hypothetical protein